VAELATRQQWTPALGRQVTLRIDGSDEQVWADTFSGLYHVPPRLPSGGWPRTILDCGSNIGLTAAHYQALFPWAKIVGVEIDAESATIAEWNAPGAKILRCGVAGTAGTAVYDSRARAEAFRLEPIDTRVSDLGLRVADQADPVYRTVSKRPLDELVREELGGFADFVKLDVEGAEWGIFRMAWWWRDVVGSLLVELHPDDEHPDDSDVLVGVAIAMLGAAGFDAVRSERHPRAVWAVRSA
jgi:FkbM family methyltransferase